MKDITGSSNIEAIGHENGTLSVRFKGGAVYDYSDFPADLHSQWMVAHDAGESVGSFFHKHIKPHYEGKKREAQ
jgi:hypothetical protein